MNASAPSASSASSPPTAAAPRPRLEPSPARRRDREVGVSAWAYATVASHQIRPWTSVAFGAAGVAYALYRLSKSGVVARLDDAHALLEECGRAPRDDFRWDPELGPPTDLDGSLYYGPAGVDLVRALVARARGDEATREQASRSLLARCAATDAARVDVEVLQGAAGMLNGARILYEDGRDERGGLAADGLARVLLDRASSDGGWLDAPGWGFGHGTSGVLHALLAWSAARRGACPDALSTALRRFAAAWRDGTHAHALGWHPAIRASFCNGDAGLALLWTKAYEVTRDALYLGLARDAATRIHGLRDEAAGNPCCGHAGYAYALLAMDRVSPGEGWHACAAKAAERAAATMAKAPGPWPNGLYKGFPGLACLFDDLDRDPSERAGFPLIEA